MIRSCENCINAVRTGDACEVIFWDFGPPPDKATLLNEIDCSKGINRFKNGPEIVQASPGRDRYAAMGRYCDSWENLGAMLPTFAGEEPLISP